MSTTWTSIIDNTSSDTIDNDIIGDGTATDPGTGTGTGGSSFNGLMSTGTPLFFGDENNYAISYGSTAGETSLEFESFLDSGTALSSPLFTFTDTATESDLITIYKAGAFSIKNMSQANFETIEGVHDQNWSEGTIVNVEGTLKILDNG